MPRSPISWVGLGFSLVAQPSWLCLLGFPSLPVGFPLLPPSSSRNNLWLVVRLTHVRSAPAAQYLFILPLTLVHHQYFCSTFLVRTTPGLSLFHDCQGAGSRFGRFHVFPALRRVGIRPLPSPFLLGSSHLTRGAATTTASTARVPGHSPRIASTALVSTAAPALD